MPGSTSPRPARARRDIYRESTDAVLATLERGTIPWRQPWNAQQGIPPRNAASGRPCRGVNFLQLALAGYQSPWWLTFKQAKDRGARVRRGAHGMTIVKWTHARRRVSDEQAARARTADGQGSRGNGAAMRIAPVAVVFCDDTSRLLAEAASSARITHAHPVGIDGAVVQAAAIGAALRDEDILEAARAAASRTAT